MRKGLLIALSSFLAAAAIAVSSSAFYLRSPSDLEVGITIGRAELTDFKLNYSQSNEDPVTGFIHLEPGESKSIAYSISPGDYERVNGNSTYVGQLSIGIDSSNTALLGAVSASNVIHYPNGSYFVSDGRNALPTESGSHQADFPYRFTGEEATFAVNLSPDAAEGIDLELTFSLTQAGPDYPFAYVTGTMTNWLDVPEFRMAPVIDGNKNYFQWEWIAKDASQYIAQGTEIKAHCGNTWCPANNNKIAPALGNRVYWDGMGTDDFDDYWWVV